MAEYGFPIGTAGSALVSFGSSDGSGSPAGTGGRLNFNTNVAANISTSATSNSPHYTLKSLERFAPLPNRLYPGSPYGMSNAPIDTQCTAQYLLLTASGLTDAAAFAALQAQINTIALFWKGTYTYNPSADNIAGVGGQWGDLVIVDGGGANRKSIGAKLIVVDIPPLAPGQVMDLMVTFTWQLQNDFV